jgi:hypothetical protein
LSTKENDIDAIEKNLRDKKGSIRKSKPFLYTDRRQQNGVNDISKDVDNLFFQVSHFVSNLNSTRFETGASYSDSFGRSPYGSRDEKQYNNYNGGYAYNNSSHHARFEDSRTEITETTMNAIEEFRKRNEKSAARAHLTAQREADLQSARFGSYQNMQGGSVDNHNINHNRFGSTMPSKNNEDHRNRPENHYGSNNK